VFVTSRLDDRSITRLQDRTSQDSRLVSADPIDNSGMYSLEPWLAIGLRQRMSLPHLLDIRRRVKVIPIGELPVQFICQATTDRRFSRSDYTHDQNDHNAPLLSICRNTTIHDAIAGCVSMLMETPVARLDGQMRDDHMGITDRIDRKWGGVPPRDRRAQSLGRLPN